VGKLKKFFGASRRIFSKNLCSPWPESVPAPLPNAQRIVEHVGNFISAVI